MNNSPENGSGSSAARGVSPEAYPDDEIDLARLWSILWVGKWKIFIITALALICAVFYLFVAQPTYRADGLLQIQAEGSSALDGISKDLGQITGKNTSPADGEIAIIKSRSVLGVTVDKLQLNVTVTPNYFPVIGHAIAKRRAQGRPAEQPVSAEQGSWFSRYAWTPVSAQVTRLVIPQQLYGKPLTLRALGRKRFILLDSDDRRIAQGQVGVPVSGKTVQGEDVHIFVAKLAISAPPTDFTLEKHSWLPVVQGLQNRLNVSEQGNDTGIVKISLEGKDRGLITRIINNISQNYVRQNVEARSKQAEKSLEFLKEQLPELRKKVDVSDSKLAEYREKNQAVDLDAEGQALLERVVNLEDKRSQLELKLAELQQTYTGKHPLLEAAQEQMQKIDQQRKRLQAKIDKLPGAQKQILSLRRDVKVNTELYTALLNRAQELRVVKAGTVGNVRIVDKAIEPVSAIAPKSSLILLLSLVLGGILGCGYVFLRAALRRGISDPKEIENQLGLSVYAVVPYSRWLAKSSVQAHRRGEVAPILARDHSGEVAVEALRSLRTSLYFAQLEAGSNVIMITGPSPGVGKSFVSINLAYLLSEIDKRVVVVDADMRKGRLHEFVEGQQREPGLSHVLTGQVSLDKALRNVDATNVKILTTGPIPPNPAELLMRESFAALINQLKQEYDLVIIDAPPVLAVTDAAVISASTPGIITFMVARAGMHPIQELEESTKRLSRQNSKIAGVVFNAFMQSHANYSGAYGGYNYYQYEYKAQG